jgi:plastocyanin
MRTIRPVVAVLAMLVLAACTSAKPGWTYAPAPSATPIPSVEASGSAAPSGGSAAPSGSAAASASASAPAASASAPASQPAGSASTGGTVLEIEAENIAYKESALTAPAGQPFKIDFKNNDSGVPHNVAIHEGSPTGAEKFKGEVFPGPGERTYDVPALPAGAYAFVCTVHPNMTGTLTVQ